MKGIERLRLLLLNCETPSRTHRSMLQNPLLI